MTHHSVVQFLSRWANNSSGIERKVNVERTGGVEIVADAREVVVGVDTHLDVHVAVALDELGRRLGELAVPTTQRGYERLLVWAKSLGCVGCVGIEGTSSYGAGLTRYLKAAGISVVEVERPKRRHRHTSGKSDPLDAEAAARVVLPGKPICMASRLARVFVRSHRDTAAWWFLSRSMVLPLVMSS